MVVKIWRPLLSDTVTSDAMLNSGLVAREEGGREGKAALSEPELLSRHASAMVYRFASGSTGVKALLRCGKEAVGRSCFLKAVQLPASKRILAEELDSQRRPCRACASWVSACCLCDSVCGGSVVLAVPAVSVGVWATASDDMEETVTRGLSSLLVFPVSALVAAVRPCSDELLVLAVVAGELVVEGGGGGGEEEEGGGR